MAILKDLIVHGSSRFLNKIYANEIQTPLIEAEAGIIKKLKADNATVVGLLDVKGQLHTSSWSNSNIATIDGSFYITPTIESASGTVTITASSLTFSGTNYAVSSLYLGDGSSITWPQYSKVLVTGQILSNGEWIPLGTLLGQLSSTATAASISINNIKDNKNQASNVLVTFVSEGITSSSYRNLKISLYQRASSSTTFYPLGIYMTATGVNGRTFLDIYGGVEVLSSNNNYGGFAEPNVRIGNLQGLPNVGGQTPSGWGIYTDNGYFKGIIAADKGYIGAGSKYWVIANEDDVVSRSYIYNGTNSITSTEEGIYLGTDGIRNYKDANTYVNITEGVITAKGVNLTGEITATSGTIAGWTIKQNYLVTGNNSGPGANILMLNGNGTTGSYTIAGTASTGWMITAGTTFGINKNGGVYATSGKIGGWTLNTDGFYITNNIPGYNANTLVISKGTASTKAIGGSDTTSKNWMISAGTGFGVTTTGVLYANNVHISGEITATSGTIGGIQLDTNGKLWITDADISGTISSNHIDVSSISIGNLSGASNYAQKADVNAINLSPYFSYSPYVVNNYWKIFNVHNGYTFTDMGDGWVRIQYTNTGSSVVRRDFAPKFNREIKEGTDYTWLIEFRNNYSTGTSTGTDFYLVEANNCQFWGGVIKENLEGSGTGSATFPISYVPTGSSEVYRKRFVKTSEATGSTHWTDGSADNLIGLACFTARCAANTTIDYEVRVSVYEGRYLGDYKPYIDSSAGNVANIALNQSVWYAECPTAAGTAVKVATISPVATDFVLTKGVTVNVKFTNTNSATNSSLQLNVNGTGAKNIKYIYNGSYSNIVAGYLKANQMYQFRYDGTYWIVQMMYNTNNYDRSQYAVSLYASEAISSARIAVLGLDGKLHILNSSSFNISCPLLYVGTTYSADDVTKPTARASNYTYWGASFNLTNTHSIQSAAANTNVYIVGTLSGNIFTPSTTVLTCAEPTTEDGLYYMLLGRMTSTTNAVLQAEHPIYIYKNGNFQKLEATTATSYITYIDANNGIRVHNESDSNNFLQLNSTAISIYRNNNINNAAVEVLRLDNNGIRIGKVNENNVFIDNDSVDIRNGQTILSSFGNNIITLGELNKSRLELTVGSITGISSQGIENFKIIGNSEEANTIQETGDINNLSILEDYNFDGTVFKGYFTPSVNLSNYESVTILIEYQIDDINRSYTFSFTPNSTSSELIPPTQELNNSTIHTREYLDITEGYCFIIKDVNKINEIEDASNIDFDPNGTTLPENSSYHFTVSDFVTYSITVRTLQHYDSSFTFGSRVNSSVIGSNSCTIGEELIANLPNQVAIGRYNENNSSNSYAFMIGNGIHGVSRRNAFSVDWNGNTKTGNLYTTGNIETNGSLKSKYFNCNGNANITGSLNIGSLTIANKIPIKAISYKFNYTLGPNVSASDSRIVNLTGYTAIGIISFGVFNAENGNPSQNVPSGIIKRCYLWGGENQLLDIDVWNKNTVESANFTVYVKVLYVQWSLF